jgi:hypothetical protein
MKIIGFTRTAQSIFVQNLNKIKNRENRLSGQKIKNFVEKKTFLVSTDGAAKVTKISIKFASQFFKIIPV